MIKKPTRKTVMTEITRILLEAEIRQQKRADAITRQDEAAPAHSTAPIGDGKVILPQPATGSESPDLGNNNRHYQSQKTGVDNV